MVKSMVVIVLTQIISLFLLFSLCLCYQTHHDTSFGSLSPHFYDNSCPKVQAIVQSYVARAYYNDPRMAASLLRLHFHDCFVNGCDGSVLLDSTGTMESEKRAESNANSARGFEFIEEIKFALEIECPQTVSCADLLALVARDSVVMSGGPCWEVNLGRRDSREASLSGSIENIPTPTSTLQTILRMFKFQGLDLTDLVALLGSHTIGNARCLNFRERLYNYSGNNGPDPTLNQNYAYVLKQGCPVIGNDQRLFNLDYVTPTKFDNQYYKNLVNYKGLLKTDEILYTQSVKTMELVKLYAENEKAFFDQFVKSIVKMGNISPLTGTKGEIRRICRKLNYV